MALTASIRDNTAASPCEEIKTPAVIKAVRVLEELQDADKSRADRSDRRPAVLVFSLRCLRLKLFSITRATSPPLAYLMSDRVWGV